MSLYDYAKSLSTEEIQAKLDAGFGAADAARFLCTESEFVSALTAELESRV